MNRQIFILAACVAMTACNTGWTLSAPSGASYAEVEPYCRHQAHLSALRQVNLDDRSGMLYPADFPSVEYRGIEDRETALCLQQHGFRFGPN